MAILYAYGYKPKASHVRTNTEIELGDLSGAGHGPDLFDIMEATLRADGRPYEVPPKPEDDDHEDMRDKYLRFEPAQIVADKDDRIICGRAWMSRKGEAERKTKLATNETVQYADDDPGDRPLFFLVSMPLRATEALVILESARPYGMTSFWGREIRTRFNDTIPSGVYPIERRGKAIDKDVILKWRPYGALETPDYIEKFLDGSISEAAAMRTVRPKGPNAREEARMIHIERDQSINRSRLAQLVRKNEKDQVARLLLPVAMVDGLGGDPEEVKFRGHFGGKEQTIVMSRSSVSQPGKEVPRTAPKDPHYVQMDTMRALAADLAKAVGHGHTWQ